MKDLSFSYEIVNRREDPECELSPSVIFRRKISQREQEACAGGRGSD